MNGVGRTIAIAMGRPGMSPRAPFSSNGGTSCWPSPSQSKRQKTRQPPIAALRRTIIIALIAFLTLVDLFATQAILPPLTHAYGVTPAAMGLAVNASTLGMAAASLAMAFLSRRIDRRRGIVFSLAALSAPTLLLAVAPGLRASRRCASRRAS